VRFHPKGWNNELWVCSIRGHHAPAARAKVLRPGVDDSLGLQIGEMRMSRCLRCECWISHGAPADGAIDTLPRFEQLAQPRRGHALEDAITMKLISVWRGLHVVIFAIVAVLLAATLSNLSDWKQRASSLIIDLNRVVGETGHHGSANFLLRNLERVAQLKSSTVVLYLLIAVGYAVLEGAEAVGLWRERRWAEYLTVVATAALLPLEIHELFKQVTIFRVFALVANIGVLVFLVWTKRLFGVRRASAGPARSGSGHEPPLHVPQ
jgi:uncharacterized membrane protein (DUF2068 family)